MVVCIKVKHQQKFECGLCNKKFEKVEKLKNHITNNSECNNKDEKENFDAVDEDQDFASIPENTDDYLVYKHNETRLFCGHCGVGGSKNGFRIAGIFGHFQNTCKKLRNADERKEYRKLIRDERKRKKDAMKTKAQAPKRKKKIETE